MSNQTILKQRYRIERRLGKGAMGDVFLAMDLQENEPVAIKTIAEELYKDPEIQQRFTREAAALRKLNHPHIISYVDAFAVGNRACLVMEYVSGGTLEDLIQQRGRLEEGFFKRTAALIIDAIATAHEAGVLHRDLKPSNILMDAALEPKIGDFGLAKVNDFSTMTTTGTAMGTLAYMAPEMFDAFAKGDQRTDIWALGVIFYEMLTGTLPFPGNSQPQVINGILNEQPLAPNILRRDIPSAWADMIGRCLQKNRQQRYQTVREMLDDLNEVPRVRQEKNPLASGFEFRFVEFAGDNDILVPKQEVPMAQKSPIVREQRWQVRESSKDKTPLAALLVSGTLVWVGILLSFGGVLFNVLRLTSAGQEVDASPELIQGLLVIGSLMFMTGLLFEAVFIRQEKWLELVILMVATGAVWFIFFSEQFLSGWFPTILGTMFYIVALLGYLQFQRN